MATQLSQDETGSGLTPVGDDFELSGNHIGSWGQGRPPHDDWPTAGLSGPP